MSTIYVFSDRNLAESPESALERRFITEYLLSKGYRKSDLQNLPEAQRKALMQEACIYAAVRLAYIEAKSKFRRKIELPR
jgi:hypothetical protein